MSGLNPIPIRQFECVLRRLGYRREKRKGKGSHIAYTKEGSMRPVIIPNHSGKDIQVYLIRQTLRTQGISEKQYFKALKKC